MLKIRGTAKPEGETKPLQGNLTVKDGVVTGKAILALNTLDTGIALRNRHMKEKYLETEKFPNAEFTFTELKLPDTLKKGEGEANAVPFKGVLKIHGVEKPVAGTVDVKLSKDKADMGFKFQTRIPDFAINTPSFLGVTVAEDVEVTVKLEGPLT
ncbi:YceI family protein [bacterium]|nr:YceI family protein [bacterium]